MLVEDLFLRVRIKTGEICSRRHLCTVALSLIYSIIYFVLCIVNKMGKIYDYSKYCNVIPNTK